jgi:hypothetical protein
LTSEISSNNSFLDTFEAKVNGELAYVKGELSSLTQWLKHPMALPPLNNLHTLKVRNLPIIWPFIPIPFLVTPIFLALR